MVLERYKEAISQSICKLIAIDANIKVRHIERDIDLEIKKDRN